MGLPDTKTDNAVATEEKKHYSPIVFVNNPVNDSIQDVIGFDAQIKTLQNAIDGGATMIGVIADYGSGKSSMTELLCNAFVKEGNPPPIRINMWDSLTQNSTENKVSDISNLTKSFLFQLANGKNSKFSSYVNKILSKNYGSIAFASSNTRRFIGWAIVAGILFALSKMSTLTGTGVSQYLPEWMRCAIPFIKVLSPCFLVLSIAALLLGFKNMTIAFSHWKMPAKREIEINDVFDTYGTIIEKLVPKGRKKQLVLIDDLDRINEKKTIVTFLKELYRFQESMTERKDRIVFIVSVKPESELIDELKATPPTTENSTENYTCIYPKVFDTTLFLKPIHFDDYDSILMGLIKNNPTKQEELEALIGEQIQDSLPASFRWIKNGTNLTLRDLKDRLNHAVAIMVSLKNKSYEGNSAADFQACTAVSYLESQFPNDYYSLIKSEEAFAKFMKDSHKVVDSAKTEGDIKALQEIFSKYFAKGKYSEDFKKALCGMVMERIFNDDFRMYFYTYPKDSHIKTTEERELCNCLLFPNQYEIPENLEECIAQAYKAGNNATIEKALNSKDTFPSIIIENGVLLNHASEVSIEKAFASFSRNVIEETDPKCDLSKYWAHVKQMSAENRNKFEAMCIQKISTLAAPALIIQKRLDIIGGFGKEILEFRQLFADNEKTPQITKEEIERIADSEVFVQLISLEKITAAQREYLCAALNFRPLISYTSVWNKAVSIIKRLTELVESDEIASDVLNFLQINGYCDDELFSTVCSADLPLEQLATYVNRFDSGKLSKVYCNLLDQLGFNAHLKEEIVFSLLEHALFFTPILFYTSNNSLHKMNPFLGYRHKIQEACAKINVDRPEIIIEFRKHCFFAANTERLDELYFNDYPLITTDEYTQFSQVNDAIHYINTMAIDAENAPLLLQIIHSRGYSPDELITLFGHLFNPDINSNCIDDITTIKTLIDQMDFKKLQVSRLSYDQRSCLFSHFSDKYVINSSSAAINFTRRFGCFIPEVEQMICDDDNADSDYCALVAELDELSDVALLWLKKNYLIAPLSEKLCERIFEKGFQTDYIVANILRENRMIMDPRIAFSSYIDAYTQVDEVFEIMSDHWDFLEQLQLEADFEKLTEKQIVPMFKVPQIQRFSSYMLSDEISDKLKKLYLLEFYKFKEEKDSVAFQKLICKPENIKLVDSIELKESISQRLWDTNPSHKGQFTKFWNKEWAGKLLQEQTV